MRTPTLLLALALATAPGALAQSRATGLVVDSATGEGLPGALIRSGTSTAWSDARGHFRIALGAELTVARVGYRPVHLVATAPGAALRVAMQQIPTPLDAIVVTAGREAGDPLAAPASISVIDRSEVAAGAALSPVDHLNGTQGFDVAAKGLFQRSYAARGFLGAASDALLVLTDFRPTAVPSIRFNVPYLVPGTDDDIERIEFQRGPGAALYGPGSDRGVLHFITRSPFDSRGTTLTVSSGSRELLAVGGRWSSATERVGGSISAAYRRGRDWPSGDSTETQARDPIAEALTADARLEWRRENGTRIIASSGFASALSMAELTPAGAYQLRNWTTGYFQARLHSGRSFANLVVNASDAGSTFNLHTASRLVDRSRQVLAQLQRSLTYGNLEATAGLDARVTDPRTGQTVHGRNENSDRVREAGGFASGSLGLGPRVSLVAAARLDHHDRLGSAVSPRAGIVARPAPNHALRLTFNRAHVTPSSATLFADFVVQNQGPYSLRVSGIPHGGFSFDQSCGGPCMRSPFTGDPAQFMPADGTLLWAAIAQLISDSADISGIPAPTAAQVPSALLLGGTTVVTAADLRDIPANRREISDAFEAGYRGLIGGILIEADLHHTRVRDVMATLAPITPNVFLDPAALAQYLAGFVTPAEAARITGLIAPIPLGTISPVQATNPDILLASRQGGSYSFVGADLAAEALLGRTVTARITWSWASRDSVPGLHGGISLGVPRNKGTAALRWAGTHGRGAAVRMRVTQGRPMASGLYSGRVDGHVALDISASTRLGAGGPELFVSAQNVLGRAHRDIPAGPLIGRMLVARLRAGL